MKSEIRQLALSVIFACIASSVLGWDGTSSETGDCVEIGEGNLVRAGEEIEVYDCESGSYRYVEVEDIDDDGYGVELEVYDQETGEYIYLEMDE